MKLASENEVFYSFNQVKRNRPRILVVKLDHMGDFLLSIPAVALLKRKFPEADIDLLCGSWNFDLALKTNLFNKIYFYDFFNRVSGIENSNKNIRSFKKLVQNFYEYDLAIDLRRQPDTRSILIEIKAKIRAGYTTQINSIDEKLDYLIQHHADVSFHKTPLNVKHISIQMMDLVNAIPSDLFFESITENQSKVVKINKQSASIGIFPNSGNSAKDWGDENYIGLISKILNNLPVYEIKVFLNEKENNFEKKLQKHNAIKLKVELDFDTLISELLSCSLIVSNNSFGAHISAYLDIPIFAIYSGHSVVDEWIPNNGIRYILTKPTLCAPCYLPTKSACQFNTKCLDISVEKVFSYIQNLF